MINIVWIWNENWNRNRNFSEVGTGTARNHYVSTTLQFVDEIETKQTKSSVDEVC